MKFRNWIRTSVGKKCFIVMGITAILSILLLWVDYHQTLPINHNGEVVVYRESYGKGKREEKLVAQIEDLEEEISITMEEQEYEDEEIQKLMKKEGDKLEQYILGENESLDLVRSDLNLINKIPDTAIEVEWETSDYHLLDTTGKIKSDELQAGGTMVTLTAILSYHKNQIIQEFPVCIYPPALTEREKMKQSLKKTVETIEKENRKKKEVVLPSEIDGNHVIWRLPRENRSVWILGLGCLVAGLIVLEEKEQKIRKAKKRRQQMLEDYPKILNQYMLLLSAGMTTKNAWERMTKEYEKKKQRVKERYAYEEMIYTLREMKSGRTEAECYEQFGKRCGVQEYLGFGIMLAQNLKKGSYGIAMILKREAQKALEERKNYAKKMGEEAGTKLLIPMVLMLTTVFVIIIVPAFLSLPI